MGVRREQSAGANCAHTCSHAKPLLASLSVLAFAMSSARHAGEPRSAICASPWRLAANVLAMASHRRQCLQPNDLINTGVSTSLCSNTGLGLAKSYCLEAVEHLHWWTS